MKMVKNLGIVASVLFLAAGVNASQAADTSMSSIKVAVVNVQQVLQQSPKVAEYNW